MNGSCRRRRSASPRWRAKSRRGSLIPRPGSIAGLACSGPCVRPLKSASTPTSWPLPKAAASDHHAPLPESRVACGVLRPARRHAEASSDPKHLAFTATAFAARKEHLHKMLAEYFGGRRETVAGKLCAPKNFGDAHRVPVYLLAKCLVLLRFLLCFLLSCH